MRINHFWIAMIIGIVSLHCARGDGLPTTPSASPKHDWQTIQYSDWAAPAKNGTLAFVVGVGDRAQGLRVDIRLPDAYQAGDVSAFLHHSDGTICSPSWSDLNPQGLVGSFGGSRPMAIAIFPWGANNLEESWIEIKVRKDRVWLEVPYGFARNPGDPLPPSQTNGPSKITPPVKQLTKRDHVRPWRSVSYDLGAIRNGWRISTFESNEKPLNIELILYRDDFVVPGPGQLWNLNSPLTTLRVLTRKKSHELLCVDRHLHPDDGMRRSDMFELDVSANEKIRAWAEIEIKVDATTRRFTIPSSLLYQPTDE